MRKAVLFATLALPATLAACGPAAPNLEPVASPVGPTGTSASADGSIRPTTTPAETPAAQPTELGGPSALSWDEAAHVVDEGQVRRVVAEAGRLWALGFTGHTSSGLGGEPVIWASATGEDWARVSLPIPVSASLQPQVLVEVEHLAAVGDRLLAFGSVSALDSSVSVAWESADGNTWAETNAPPVNFVTDVTSGPAGLVLTSRGYGEGTGGVWLSPDGGLTWVETTPSPGTATMSAVVGTSDHYVLVGTLIRPDGRPQPAVWISPDGRSWSQAELEGHDADGSVSAVTLDGSGRWVAIGLLRAAAATWRSSDGATWELTEGFLPAGDRLHGSGWRLTGLPRGFLIVDLYGTAWFSGDGAVWQTIEAPPSPEGGEHAGGIARIAERIIIIHNDAPFTTGGAANEAWTSWLATASQ